jgi:hypothetical protein
VSGLVLTKAQVSSSVSTIGTKDSQKTWTELFACPGKSFEQKVVRVGLKESLDLLIKLLEKLFLKATQLAEETFGTRRCNSI